MTKNPVADALRAAGFTPCPRWWLTQEQMDLVEYMAKQNADEVNRIRFEAKLHATPVQSQVDQAWEKWRQEREEK